MRERERERERDVDSITEPDSMVHVNIKFSQGNRSQDRTRSQNTDKHCSQGLESILYSPPLVSTIQTNCIH